MTLVPLHRAFYSDDSLVFPEEGRTVNAHSTPAPTRQPASQGRGGDVIDAAPTGRIRFNNRRKSLSVDDLSAKSPKNRRKSSSESLFVVLRVLKNIEFCIYL